MNFAESLAIPEATFSDNDEILSVNISSPEIFSATRFFAVTVPAKYASPL
jgi:hypothetical protein